MQEQNPFPGPQVISQTQWLAGRADILQQIKDAIDQRDAHDPAVLFIVGSSGMGKSSLLEAGVLNNAVLFPESEYQRIKVNYEINYETNDGHKEEENKKGQNKRSGRIWRRVWEWICKVLKWICRIWEWILGNKKEVENKNEKYVAPWVSFQNTAINPKYSLQTTTIDLSPDQDPDTVLWTHLHQGGGASGSPLKQIYILDNFETYFQWPNAAHLIEGERLIRGLDPIFRDTYPNADPRYRRMPHNRNYFFIVALRSEQFAIVSQYFPGLGAYSIFLHGLGKAEAYDFIRNARKDVPTHLHFSELEAETIVSHSLREGSIFSHEVDPFILSISCYIAYERKFAADALKSAAETARCGEAAAETAPRAESAPKAKTPARKPDATANPVLSFVRNAIKKFCQVQTASIKDVPLSERAGVFKRALHACIKLFLSAAAATVNTAYKLSAWKLERAIIRRFLRIETDISSISVDSKSAQKYFSQKSLDELTNNCILKKIALSAQESIYRLYHYRIAQAMGSAELERIRRQRIRYAIGIPVLGLAVAGFLLWEKSQLKAEEQEKLRKLAGEKFPLELREARFVSDLREERPTVRWPAAKDNYDKAVAPYKEVLTNDEVTRKNAIDRLEIISNEKRNLALWRLIGGWEESTRSQFDVISGLEWVRKKLAALPSSPSATPAAPPPPAAPPSPNASQTLTQPSFTLQDFQSSLLNAYAGSKIHKPEKKPDSSPSPSEPPNEQSKFKDDRLDLIPSEFDTTIKLEEAWSHWLQLGTWLENIKDMLAAGGKDTAVIASVDQFLQGYVQDLPQSQAQMRVNVTVLAARLAALDFKFRAQLRLWSASYDSAYLASITDGVELLQQDVEAAHEQFHDKVKTDPESVESVVAIGRQVNALHLMAMRIQRIASAVAALKQVMAGSEPLSAYDFDRENPLTHDHADNEDGLEENRNTPEDLVELDQSYDTLVPTDMGFTLASAVGKFLSFQRHDQVRKQKWYLEGVKQSKDKEKWSWGPFQAAILVEEEDNITWEQWHSRMKDAATFLCSNGSQLAADDTATPTPEKTCLAWYTALHQSVAKAERALDTKHLTEGFKAFKDSVSHLKELQARQKEEVKNGADLTSIAFYDIEKQRLLFLSEVIRSIHAALREDATWSIEEKQACAAALKDWDDLPGKPSPTMDVQALPILKRKIEALENRRTAWIARSQFSSLPPWYSFAEADAPGFKDQLQIQHDCMQVHRALDQGFKPDATPASLPNSLEKIRALKTWGACWTRALVGLTQYRIDTEQYRIPSGQGATEAGAPFQNIEELDQDSLGKEFIRVGHLAVLNRSLEWWLDPWEGGLEPKDALTHSPARFQQEHSNLLFACASQFYHDREGKVPSVSPTLKALVGHLFTSLTPELNYRFQSQKNETASAWLKIPPPKPATSPEPVPETSYPVMSESAISARLCLRMAAEVPVLIVPAERTKWLPLLFEEHSPSVPGQMTKRYETCQFEANLWKDSFNAANFFEPKPSPNSPPAGGAPVVAALPPQTVSAAWELLLKGSQVSNGWKASLAELSRPVPVAFYRLGFSAELNQMFDIGNHQGPHRIQRMRDSWRSADDCASHGWQDTSASLTRRTRRYSALDSLVTRGTRGFNEGKSVKERKDLEVEFHVWCLANSHTVNPWAGPMVPYKEYEEELSKLVLRCISENSGESSKTLQVPSFEAMGNNTVQQAFGTLLKGTKLPENKRTTQLMIKNWFNFWITIRDSEWRTSGSPGDLMILKNTLSEKMENAPQQKD